MYAVYRTTYVGTKMPKFYIGSSSLSKIQNGYRGSVRSKKYREVWKEELRTNPQLFSIEILSIHEDRYEALVEEKRIQEEIDVIKRPDYINRGVSLGIFGLELRGERNPFFSRKLSEEAKKKISDAKKGKTTITETGRLKCAAAASYPRSEKTKQKMRKPKSDATRKKMSLAHQNRSPEYRAKLSAAAKLREEKKRHDRQIAR